MHNLKQEQASDRGKLPQDYRSNLRAKNSKARLYGSTKRNEPAGENIMKVKSTVAIGIVIALASSGVFAQDKEPEKMGGMMKEHHAKMSEMHQKMEATWKEQNAELDKLVTQMNSAQGDQKVSAMAAVVSKLVEIMKKEHEEMAAMHQKMEAEHHPRKEKSEASASPDEHSKHLP
jgi:cytochrome c556